MRLPDFFIIGAMKSGTTFLVDRLGQHPHINFSAIKEPAFFNHMGDRQIYDSYVGLPMVHEYLTLNQYSKLYESFPFSTLIGDASAQYLCDPGAAQHIAKIRPNAKIIAVLRHPTDRAYSAYNHKRSFGEEKFETFSEAITDELAGNRQNWWYSWRYLHGGMYFKHLSNYFSRFSSEQILVVNYSQIAENPQLLFKQVFNFLGVEPHQVSDTLPINETRIPKNKLHSAMKHFIGRRSTFKQVISHVLPLPLRSKVRKELMTILSHGSARPEAINPKISETVTALYANELRLLRSELGINFF